MRCRRKLFFTCSTRDLQTVRDAMTAPGISVSVPWLACCCTKNKNNSTNRVCRAWQGRLSAAAAGGPTAARHDHPAGPPLYFPARPHSLTHSLGTKDCIRLSMLYSLCSWLLHHQRTLTLSALDSVSTAAAAVAAWLRRRPLVAPAGSWP